MATKLDLDLDPQAVPFVIDIHDDFSNYPVLDCAPSEVANTTAISIELGNVCIKVLRLSSEHGEAPNRVLVTVYSAGWERELGEVLVTQEEAAEPEA